LGYIGDASQTFSDAKPGGAVLSLRLIRTFLSSNYREEPIELELTGVIRGSWQDEEARLPRDLEYRPQLTN
jgi:hypothetical protein